MNTGLTSLLAVLGAPGGFAQGGAGKTGAAGLLQIGIPATTDAVGNNNPSAFGDIISLLLNPNASVPLPPEEASNLAASLSQLSQLTSAIAPQATAEESAALPDFSALLDDFPGLAALLPQTPVPVATAVPVVAPVTDVPAVSEKIATVSLSENVAVQPATSQPATSQPVISQPVISQPVISQPIISQPATPLPYHSLVSLNEVVETRLPTETAVPLPPEAIIDEKVPEEAVQNLVTKLKELFSNAAPAAPTAIAETEKPATAVPLVAAYQAQPEVKPKPQPEVQPENVPAPAVVAVPKEQEKAQKEVVSAGKPIDDAEILAKATDASRPALPLLQNAIVQPVAVSPANKEHHAAAEKLFQASGKDHISDKASSLADNPADSTAPTANNTSTNVNSSSVAEISPQRDTVPVLRSAPAATPGPVEQVAVKIVHLGKDSGGRIEMKLEPEELGKIEIKMHFTQEGHTHVSIRAERTETLELLQKDRGNLERALADSGLKTDSGSLSFDLRGGNDAWKQRHYEEQGNNSGYTRVANNENTPPAEEVVRATNAYYYVGNLSIVNGVDIHV